MASKVFYPKHTSSKEEGAIFLIYDNIASSAIASWDITNIPQIYNHLQIMIQARSDTAATSTTMNMRVNGDSSASYDYSNLQTAGSTASALEGINQTSFRVSGITAASANSAYAGISTIIVYNYTNTIFRKNFTTQGGRIQSLSTTNLVTEFDIAMWDNTAAINQITIFPGAGNFITGSRLSIYGIN